MSGIDAPDDGLLDRSLSSYYEELAGSPVPVKLHGRIVRSIRARGETRVAGRGLRHDLARLAPAALVAMVIAGFVLAALPWAQLGRTDLGLTGPGATATASATAQATAAPWPPPIPTPPTPGPTPVPTPFPPGATRIWAVNRGASLMTVTVGEQVVGQLTCGQTGSFAVTTYPSEVLVAADQDSTSTVITSVSAPLWWIYGPGSFATYEGAPPTDQSYSVCPTRYQGDDPTGVVTWNFNYPTVSGTPGGTATDATINQAISGAAEQWAAQLAADLATLRGRLLPQTGTGQLFGSWVADTSLPGWLRINVIMDPTLDPAPSVTIPEWTAYLEFDLSDGHRIGVDELFTNPANGLAVLSAQTRQIMGLASDGGAYAAATAPDALEAAMWHPECDGLHLVFQDPTVASWPAASLYQREVVIPWSALKSVIKPDSPVRSVMAAKCPAPSPLPEP